MGRGFSTNKKERRGDNPSVLRSRFGGAIRSFGVAQEFIPEVLGFPGSLRSQG